MSNRFSSTYQPTPEAKSNGHRLANLRRRVLTEALNLKDENSSVWQTMILNLREELIKKNNAEMIIHILDKLAPKADLSEKPPLQLVQQKPRGISKGER